ncbi:acetyl-CoA carboxylase biotin carboxylase subunit [Aestuariirhabdus sp. Z084]|uniref:acetyl/propionyl/methylcrotonyl-CoA carboxylase subunit alpha n=1 Tax=Aestuariirhabdus haliotis TaxID=2918751 RepID=UPI00201B425E|nr:acetyl-CoA carboxylase biotin carboxylase subunit [Aestuariirhabdus haliotis]MCL6414709.1 acetyl-CoA carboxylase biotin carboxylase subunit [Aestuariirhabdus haliotis]MCL6418641.1 acetyl-CoA carboxylase biotin carboxylase subunit [Aestuariirhabdus haliotis]
MPAIEKVLVANRGEIAVRVLRSARSLGYRTVAVFSQADRHSLHVAEADEAICIGEGPVQSSYLDAEQILKAAQRTGANAVHPGYGFLSENAEFSAACEQAGLIFIGPSAQAIELMGSKRQSKIAMIDAGVPTVPGYEGEDQSLATLRDAANRIGFPLMIKASAGGGGRGMRLVTESAELEQELERAASEALSAFGNDELILEKAVIAPRHIEIQVFGDQLGNCIHLGERDCSIQRRHQKVVEEAPSPFVDETLRQKMGAAAVKAAQACQYVGAGTVEFLVDSDRNFYFLEMNTRLQVEHPVTELVTNTDLVAWQLRVAEGLPLPLTQDEVTLSGHAIEVRLYAEDPAHNYLPQTGIVTDWSPANLEGLRIDHNLATGSEISPFYDSMQAKIICWGETREVARRRLVRSLEETTLFGVRTNKHFLRNILKHENFAQGLSTTAFINDQFSDDPSLRMETIPDLPLALATGLLVAHDENFGAHNSWHSAASARTRLSLRSNDSDHIVYCTALPDSNSKTIDIENGTTIKFDELLITEPGHVEFMLAGQLNRARFSLQSSTLELEIDGAYYAIENRSQLSTHNAAEGSATEVKAPMDGSLVALMVNSGDKVTRGQTLAVVEAMKMEHPLKAEIDGVVEDIRGQCGDQVKTRQTLIHLSILAPDEQ